MTAAAFVLITLFAALSAMLAWRLLLWAAEAPRRAVRARAAARRRQANDVLTRGFVAAAAGGTLLGGGIAWFLTRDKSADAGGRAGAAHDASSPRVVPMGGVIGSSATRDGSTPAYGVGARGTW
jgi:hypothetical protein